MSWDSYCDNLLANNLSYGAVVGSNGAIWAQKPHSGSNICMSEAEAMAISKGLAEKQTDQFIAKGIVVGAEKYMFLRKDDADGSVQAKKKACGISIYPAKTCFVVGMYDEKMQPGECSKAVYNLGSYLKDNNY